MTFLLGMCAMSACVSRHGRPLEVVRKPAPPSSKRPYSTKPAERMPFSVLDNREVPPQQHFVLSGFMGDVADLRVAGSYTNVLSEDRPVLKVRYVGRGPTGWAGAVWMNPANSWGAFDGGYNLTEASNLSFWARGQTGKEIVSFTCGGMAANYPDSENISTGEIQLSKEWMEYVVDLSGLDMSYISAGFGFTVKQNMNPNGCKFFLDQIQFN